MAIPPTDEISGTKKPAAGLAAGRPVRMIFWGPDHIPTHAAMPEKALPKKLVKQ